MSRDGKHYKEPPSFDAAPEWAMWLAQDESGKWHWFANRPILVSMPDDGELYWAMGIGSNQYKAQFAGNGLYPKDPATTLQERPSANAK